MKGIIGKKIGMTHFFSEDGTFVSCTVVEAGPCIVLQKKIEETDGYSAIQVGFDDAKEKNSNKAQITHAKKANTGPKPPELLSTHPADNNRISAIRKFVPSAMKYYKKWVLLNHLAKSQIPELLLISELLL